MCKITLKIILMLTIIFFPQEENIKKTVTPFENIPQNITHNEYNYKEMPIGSLIIEKINLYQNIYDLNSKNNSIERNVTILEGSIDPDNPNSIMFIAAHSGSGQLAFFKDLDKLEINDEIALTYKNKKYTYYVNKIWEQEKSTYIDVYKDSAKQLILTTCSPSNKNKQLIISSTIKEF